MPEAAHISVIKRTRVPIAGVVPWGSGRLWSALSSLTAGLFKIRKIKRFKMQDQCHSNWCWATVASSVSFCYKEPSPHTQCAIANLQLKRPDCCTFPCHSPHAPGVPNAPNTLGAALNYAGHVLQLYDPDVQADASKISGGDRSGTPRMRAGEWKVSGGAHFLAIVGYDPDTGKLDIADSLSVPKPCPSMSSRPCIKTKASGTTRTIRKRRPPNNQARSGHEN